MEMSVEKNNLKIDKNIEYNEEIKWKSKYKSLKNKNLELRKMNKKLKKALFFKYFVPNNLLNFFMSKPEVAIQLAEKSLDSVREVYMTLLTINIEICKELAVLEGISITHDEELNYQKHLLMTKYSKRKKLINKQILLAADNANELERLYRLVKIT